MKSIYLAHILPSRCVLRALAVAVIGVTAAKAAWTQQTINLRPGWNAVWLEVTPEPNDIETVFQGLPIKSVWRHETEKASPRYIDDSTSLKPDPERWLTWTPGQASGAVLKSLQRIHGGAAYLVEVTGASNVTWTVIGRPVMEDLSWLNASYSLSGLCVDPSSAVTFSQFFTGSSAHQSANIRRIQADGSWITIPSSTQIQRGEAYWIFSNGISSFQGQGSIQVDDRGLLDYGSTVVEQGITISNNTSSNANFTASLEAATIPPGVLSAGAVQLSLWRDGSNGSYGWEPLAASKTVSVLANTKKTIRLAIRRADMPGQGVDRRFFGILKVTGLNMCGTIGVVADGYAAGAAGNGASTRFAGLWAGQCTLNSVNEPAGANASVLQPTASEASLRILLRVAPNGSVSLLREANVFWLDGLTNEDGTVAEAGRFVVAGSAAEIATLEGLYGTVGSARLKGAAVRDGINIPRRISSVGFSFSTPQSMTGTFNPLSGSITGTIQIGYDDDLNPYKHRYHPDHDNIKDGSQAAGVSTPLPEGVESYDISRQITLTFQGLDPEGLRFPGWGDSVAGGTYSETIHGLHRNPIKTSGTFRLSRVVTE